MPELDELRLETIKAMEKNGFAEFKEIQREFVKAKNRLIRIPLRERTW